MIKVMLRLAPAFLLMPVLAWGQSGEDASAVAQLVAVLAQTDSMRTDVTQLTLDQNGREIQQSTARLVMRKPDHFYWRTISPYEEIMTTDGDTLWIYEPDLEQVTIQNFARETGRTPALLLSGDEADLGASFVVSATVLSQDNRTRFTLQPLEAGNLFERMSLTFFGALLEEMQFEDSLGQKTSLTFENLERNVEVNEALFGFQAPPGVEVIDNTR